MWSDPGAFPVLHHLAVRGPSRQGPLADALGLDASTVSRHVRSLVADGWVEVARDPDDGRATVLTITARGAGKISSSHDYPVRGRGGQGVMAMDKAMRGGPLVASFPVERDDQIMLATSTGQSIRVPVDGISFRSRTAGGVRVFNTGADETVVSVARIAENGEDEGEEA